MNRIGRQLKGFVKERVSADYKADWDRSYSVAMAAEKSLSRANRIFKSLDEHMKTAKKKPAKKVLSFKK